MSTVTNYVYNSGIPAITSTGSVSSVYEVSDNREFYPKSMIISNISDSNDMWLELFDYDATDSEGDNSNHMLPKIHLSAKETMKLTEDDLAGLVVRQGIGAKVGHADGVEIFVRGEEKGGPNRTL